MSRAARCRALFDRVADPPAVARSFECFTEQPPNAYIAAIEACEEADETAPVAVSALPRGAATVPEPADLTDSDVASALGCHVKTLRRAIAAGRLVDDAAPVVVGGGERVRRRWRASQLPAIRAAFAPVAPPVSPPIVPSAPTRSGGRPPAKKKAKTHDGKPRKDILARLRDGD